MIKLKYSILASLGLLTTLLLSNGVMAQRMDRITHLKGTKTIHGVQVTVSQEGFVDSLTYCGDDTGPYFAGNDYSQSCCKTGSYIFKFSQPIKEAFLNISALSTSTTYDEEAEIYVNGSHYKVTNIGHENSCEPIAIISAEGNIRPCAGCGGSGANKIKIVGPITTLKVTCKIISGQPQGMVFAVYMGEKADDQMSNTLVHYTALLDEVPGGKQLVIESNQLDNAIITIKNNQGYLIPLHYTSIESTRITIDATDLAKGEYLLEMNFNNEIEKQKILIN